MKVKQIVSEHKKGVRAHIYNKKATIKAQGAVPLYGPDKQDAKLKPVKMNEAPEDRAILAQVNALKQSNPRFAAELQSKNLQLARGMGPESQKHNAAVMQQYKMLVQKYSGTPVQEELPGQMVGKVQQVKPDGTVDIQKPSGDTTTVQATALQPGDNNKLTMQVPKIQPGMEVDASKTIEENPSGAVAQVNTKVNPPMVMDNAMGGSPLGVTKTGEEITPELIARSTDWQERTIQANGKTYTALYSGTRGYRVGQKTYQAITGGAMPMRESVELDAIKRLSGL